MSPAAGSVWLSAAASVVTFLIDLTDPDEATLTPTCVVPAVSCSGTRWGTCCLGCLSSARPEPGPAASVKDQTLQLMQSERNFNLEEIWKSLKNLVGTSPVTYICNR